MVAGLGDESDDSLFDGDEEERLDKSNRQLTQ